MVREYPSRVSIPRPVSREEPSKGRSRGTDPWVGATSRRGDPERASWRGWASVVFFASLASSTGLAQPADPTDTVETQTEGASDDAAEGEGGEQGPGQGDERRAPARTLRVGVSGTAPFVVESDEDLSGFSVELWRQIGVERGWPFELEVEPNTEALLAQVAAGEVDVGVGPLSITAERQRRVEFTQPYAQSALAIAAPPGSSGLFATVRPFLTTAFLSGAGLFLLILCLVGALFWLTERKRNPDQFPAAPLPGIGNGIWLALVTMTTVGYGDRHPITTGGRVVAGVWMVLSLILGSSLTAFLATALTLLSLDESSIQTADELKGRRVATVEGTTAESFVRAQGARPVLFGTLGEAIEAATKEGADAVVFDRPTLHHELGARPEVELVLSDATYDPVGFGFAFPPTALQLRSDANVTLLELSESGRLERLEAAWLGN